jgi:hypothetical protein
MVARMRALFALAALAGCSGNGDGNGTTADARPGADAPLGAPDARAFDAAATNGVIDAATGDTTTLAAACAASRAAWRSDVAALGRACNENTDCTLIGRRPTPTCNGAQYLAVMCEGAPVPAAAVVGTDLAGRATAWYQACGELSCSELSPCIADCAPGEASCLAGMCIVSRGNCFPQPGGR